MELENLQDARILIIDDQSDTVDFLRELLRKFGYRNLQSTTDPSQALKLYSEFRPDLVLLDLHMPLLDGLSVMKKLRSQDPANSYLPILVLTADHGSEAKQSALSMGAKDFVSKPFDTTEILLRIRNLLETRALHLQLQNQNQILEEKVHQRTADLEQARLEILERLALAAEYRDDSTGQHTTRVSQTSVRVAKSLGLSAEKIDLIRKAAPLHDIGKIGIPDSILLKPGRLTPAEFERMKTHTTIGGKILSGSRSPLLKIAREIALYHHERWDGGGYARIAGEDIPLEGRIVAIADSFDALTHERPYKSAWPAVRATEEIERQSGAQFDPLVVAAFLAVQARIQ
ncbi:MAG TPA: HD domain-containing phosphohydrolase [Acidobacteriota bacterium]|jgi:putative two-component system response regulator|nr:HD domain-containing phosphohydrolase [Acidobacteriota bacterium]